MEKGRIINLSRKDYYVKSGDSIYVCQARGKFYQDKISLVVGDIVEFDVLSNNQGYIQKLLPRKNQLLRPSISNVDQALIVISVESPKFSTSVLDKLILLIQYNNIEPIICISKMDLLKNNKQKIKKTIKYYKKKR